MIELALIVFMLVLFVGGAVNWGFAYREMSAITDAARAGARVASASSLDLERFLSLDYEENPAHLCSTLEETAQKVTRSNMTRAGLDPKEWRIRAKVCRSVAEWFYIFDSDTSSWTNRRFYYLDVNIRRKKDGKGCIFCSDRLWYKGAGPSAEATYLIEGNDNNCRRGAGGTGKPLDLC